MSMEFAVYTRNLPPPSLDRREILRYAGMVGEASPTLEALLEECLEEITPLLSYRVCYGELSTDPTREGFCPVFFGMGSRSLERYLSGCEGALLFAATVGLELDRLLARYATLSPTKALLLQAIGAERIESLCDAFEAEVKEEKARLGLVTRPRFSPGYGDFSIEAQREIFSLLDCPRRIGLSLNQSLLMSPTKSVTAIIGIGKQDENY